MTSTLTHHTEHRIEVDAPARAAYDLIADVGNWPVVFPPTVHVEHVEKDETTERIRIWATANDAVKGWTSRRELDPVALRIRFRQEISQPPVAAMGGEWIIEPRSGDRCAVLLTHDYRAVGDDSANADWIAQAVDRNSTAELNSLKAAAEGAAARGGLLLTFDDVVHVAADPAAVYAFINEADQWAQRLPHVASVRMTEESPGLQLLEMDTRTPDGNTHTTKSARICFPHDRIIYKQSRTPALMSVHTGTWRFTETTDGTAVTSTHTVVLVPEAVPGVLGAGADLDDAKDYVRNALGRNSTATMLAAKQHAERRTT
ncbi:aromatase/cyclase [Saccharopolyspora sp. 5N708]|uniref:aromatase/cyclase n=1 Tax=Saccharopolyspora sp. 5N708 TaxID=3457424 RepID=UPI003FCFDE38